METNKLKSLNTQNENARESPLKKELGEIEENGPQTQRFSAGVSSMGRNAKSFATLKDN